MATSQEHAITGDPPVTYGAVYFRKSNPPPGDWARDYGTAAGDGMNTFRHWFLWGAIEVAPGEFDWADYDRQLDLAAEHGIKTIIAEMITDAPEWAYHRYADARYETCDGSATDLPEIGGWRIPRASLRPGARWLTSQWLDAPALVHGSAFR